MSQELFVYNTLSRTKEKFEPLNPPFVGMYVCGPTVYGEPHLGHARSAISFDLIFRYLNAIGYKTRYVRNITDVGHLVDDADEGDDKIAKKARLEKLEPMEIVQKYTNIYHQCMDRLNVLRPSIEPKASGHIIEQQLLIEKILKNGFAYETNGSVYFDIEKYNKCHHYGKLSGRVLEDLLANTRQLDGQSEKRNPFDFALWKKASPEHIMRWPSIWSDGFPGWHLECTAMGAKYLGEKFDIHGGGMDLLFPHHECEIAQAVGGYGHETVKYWLHNNLITINGQKMGKSLGNFITLHELFTGEHELLEQAYDPMTIRFFVLQSYYRKPLDFSNEALQASEKGMQRLLSAIDALYEIQPVEKSTGSFDVEKLENNCYAAMNDDFNTPILIATLFDGVKIINSAKDKKIAFTADELEKLKIVYTTFVNDVLGIVKQDTVQEQDNSITNKLVDFILHVRQESKQKKDWVTADKIRNTLNELGIDIKDSKDGFEWNFKD